MQSLRPLAVLRSSLALLTIVCGLVETGGLHLQPSSSDRRSWLAWGGGGVASAGLASAGVAAELGPSLRDRVEGAAIRLPGYNLETADGERAGLCLACVIITDPFPPSRSFDSPTTMPPPQSSTQRASQAFGNAGVQPSPYKRRAASYCSGEIVRTRRPLLKLTGLP